MKIVEVATFRAPIERVFSIIADGSQAIRWVSGVVRSERVGEEKDAPIVVGSRFHWKVQLGPFLRDESVQEITVLQPNEKIGFRGTVGMPIEGQWLFRQRDELTEVTYEATISTEGRRLGRLMGSSIGRELWASSIRTSLVRLRRLVETPGA